MALHPRSSLRTPILSPLSHSSLYTTATDAMAPDLKPLLLPQLVEERRRLETQAQHALMTQHAPSEFDLSIIYYTTNSSSSDVGSPVTPTFSARGHLRYSSSVSSLDLPFTFAEPPSSPSQQAHPAKLCVRQLPDVEEEPMERGEFDLPEDLYDCLCKTSPTELWIYSTAELLQKCPCPIAFGIY